MIQACQFRGWLACSGSGALVPDGFGRTLPVFNTPAGFSGRSPLDFDDFWPTRAGFGVCLPVLVGQSPLGFDDFWANPAGF